MPHSENLDFKLGHYPWVSLLGNMTHYNYNGAHWAYSDKIPHGRVVLLNEYMPRNPRLNGYYDMPDIDLILFERGISGGGVSVLD